MNGFKINMYRSFVLYIVKETICDIGNSKPKKGLIKIIYKGILARNTVSLVTSQAMTYISFHLRLVCFKYLF